MKTNDRSRRWRRWPLAALLATAALGALLVAGCGGSSGGSETASAASGSGSSSTGEAGQGPGGFQLTDEQQTCLKEQGVEMPEPGQGGPQGGEGAASGEGPPSGEMPGSGEGPPSGEPPQGGEGPGGAQGEEMKEAFEACGVEMPEGKPDGAGGGAPNTNSASFRKSVKKYTACMRENGYEMPEPNFSGEGPVFDESEVDRESPKFEKASAKCQSLLGGPQS